MTEETARDLTEVMRELVTILKKPNALTLTISDAAKLYGVSRHTFARYIKDGLVPMDEFGRVSRKAVEVFAQRSLEQ